jgi:hypothetical protein
MTLYYTKEDYTTPHNVMQHYTTLYKAIQYYTMLIIQDYATLYKTIQHYTTLYNNILEVTIARKLLPHPQGMAPCAIC